MSEPENDPKAKPRVNVTIDQEGTIRLAKENQKLQDQLEGKLNSIESKDVTSEIGQVLRDKLIQAYADKGHTCPALTSKADYEGAVDILKDLPDKKTPSGSAPLNGKQWGNGQPPTYDAHGNLMNKRYSSYAEMFQDLHDIEAVHKGDPKGLQATKAMQDIVRKFFDEHKQNNSPVPNLIKEMPETIEVNGLRVCKNPEDGDLQAWNRAFRRRKLLERQERGSVAVKGESDQ